MKQGHTIPAAVLDLIGCMIDSDPPARFVNPKGYTWSWHPGDHTLIIPNRPTDRLLVEQSEPTLLRVLARHLGWSGNGRPFLMLDLGGPGTGYRWVLRALDRFGFPVMPERFEAWMPDHDPNKLEHLEALAAAVVWYGRVTRLKAWQNATDRATVSAVYQALAAVSAEKMPSEAAQIAWVEQHHDWPPLEVKP